MGHEFGRYEGFGGEIPNNGKAFDSNNIGIAITRFTKLHSTLINTFFKLMKILFFSFTKHRPIIGYIFT